MAKCLTQWDNAWAPINIYFDGILYVKHKCIVITDIHACLLLQDHARRSANHEATGVDSALQDDQASEAKTFRLEKKVTIVVANR